MKIALIKKTNEAVKLSLSNLGFYQAFEGDKYAMWLDEPVKDSKALFDDLMSSFVKENENGITGKAY